MRSRLGSPSTCWLAFMPSLCYNRKREVEQDPLKIQQARNPKSSRHDEASAGKGKLRAQEPFLCSFTSAGTLPVRAWCGQSGRKYRSWCIRHSVSTRILAQFVIGYRDEMVGKGVTVQTTAGNPKRHTPRQKASPRARTNDARTGAHKQGPKQPATTRNTE